MRVILLGAGRVGAAIARDLADDDAFDLSVADADASALEPIARAGVRVVAADLSRPGAIADVTAGHDLVVCAVPGPIGFETVRSALEAGHDVVDISFFEEDAFELDALARERGCTAIVDCGVAPGFSNLVLGHLEATLETTARFRCVVGGLPRVRRWPYEYRAPFSPIDVLAEYTRPARLRRGGREVVLPALSEVELVDFDGVGTLEAFNTDGLRTLLRTARTPELAEKTLRYPGHADRMRMLRDSGFFDAAAIDVAGTPVRPLDVTARLLFEAWRFEPGEADLTVMRIEVDGTEAGEPVRHTWELLDRYDDATATLSMARTTGYTCTAVVRLLERGLYRRPGVSPPEYVGAQPGCFEFVVERLAERGVAWRHTRTSPPA